MVRMSESALTELRNLGPISLADQHFLMPSAPAIYFHLLVCGLEISLNNGSGTHHCPFLWAKKVFSTGDYICCMGNDREGFIQIVDAFQLSILQQHEDGCLDVHVI